jgi:hypothetical protein
MSLRVSFEGVQTCGVCKTQRPASHRCPICPVGLCDVHAEDHADRHPTHTTLERLDLATPRTPPPVNFRPVTPTTPASVAKGSPGPRPVSSPGGRGSDIDVCVDHNEELKYMCETCQVAICVSCKLVGVHAPHTATDLHRGCLDWSERIHALLPDAVAAADALVCGVIILLTC